MENGTELQTANSQNKVIDTTQIVGWGIDADPENDPAYPMKQRVSGEHAGYTWDRPTQQKSDVEVLHSNERPNLSAVYGTTLPPAGLSGALRRFAFNYSEDSYSHWLPLMAADRVQVVEGVLDDLKRGRIPNVFSELGWKAEWRHDPQRLIGKIVIGAAVAGFAVALLSRRRNEARYRDE